jgi:PD-(D/E)XK endonuclease
MRTTQRKGDIAVAQFIATFTRLGYDIALPITESAAYDVLLDDSGIIRRVQVRYTSGSEVDLRRIHSNSTGYVVKKTIKDAYDWLYILKGDGSEYLIKRCLDSRRSIKPQELHRIRLAEREGFEPSRGLSPP